MDKKEYLINIFSERLVTVLNQQKMSNAELARRCGLSRSIISDYIDKKRFPRGRTLFAISSALNVSTEWLTGKPGAEMQLDVPELNNQNDYNMRRREIIALFIYEYSQAPFGFLDLYEEIIRIISSLNKTGLDKMIELGNDFTNLENYKLNENDLLKKSSDELLEEKERFKRLNSLLSDTTRFIDRDSILYQTWQEKWGKKID